MAINNTYVLEVDMKRQMTQRVPKFRKGDSGILIFKLFDDGMEYDISSVTKAELYHKTSKGNIIESKCDFIQYEGKRAIRYVYEGVAMIETGINETLLVVYEGDKTVSIQPFPVVIYDDFKGGAGSFVELIQELQNKINGLVMDLTQTIKIAEKGKPNGVATLDSSGKIPFAQLPSQIDAYIDHIKHTVWKNQVHGLRLNDDGILQYKTSNGSWQNVGFAEDATSGGGTGVQFLDVEISKNNGVITLTYTGVPTVQLQKIAKGDYNKPYFLTNGSTFTGTSFTVTELGLYTLYYKDSNGLEYVKLFNIDASNLVTPTVSVTVNNGDVTVDISTSISIKKWAKGSQTIAYFQSQGTVFTGNTFVVDSVGVYTVYYKTTAGVEYVYEFNVIDSMLKDESISALPSYTEFTIGTIKAILLEPDTGLTIIPKWGSDKFDNAGSNIYSTTDTNNVGYRLNKTSNPFYQSLLSNGLKEEDILMSEWGIGKVDISEERVPNDTTPPSWYERVRNIEMSSKVTAKIGLISFTQYTKHHSFYTNTGKLTDYIGWTLTPYRTTSNPNPSPPQVYGPSENPQYGLTMIPASTYGWVSPTFYLSQDAKIIDGKYVGNGVIQDTTLPVFLEYTDTEYQIDEKYRYLKITAKNAYKFVVKGGDYNPNQTSYGSTSNFDSTYRTMNNSSMFDITKNNGSATIEVYDSSNKLIHTLQWKTSTLYNYIIVDNTYISLERIKSNSTTVTVPTTIDGLPVLDMGTVYFRRSITYDSYNVENVIIPKEVIYGGSFCHDTLLAAPQKKLKSVTINNSDFTFTNDFALYQETSNYTIKVPINSNTLAEVKKFYNPYAYIQTF